MGEELPKTICPVPWVNLSLDVNGSCRPCCKYEQAARGSTRDLGNLKNNTLQELWNSQGMIQLRRDFRNGVKPVECAQCWNEEDAGIESFRQEFTRNRIKNQNIEFENLEPMAPKALDLKLSNLCNSKCRICGPVASSLWLREEEVYDPESITSIKLDRDFLISNKITENKTNFEIFQEWIPSLEHIELFGGEPLISKENREIEQLLVSKGVSKNISLHYNTNVTLFNDEILNIWRNFKKVTVCLSLDDIGPRLEYERYPSKWNVVHNNLLKYCQIKNAQIIPMLFCSVSNFNIWYLPEYIQWVEEHYPNLELRFNIVHDSPEYCIVNCPNPVKKKISKKLTSVFNREHKLKFTEIERFINSRPGNMDLWHKFKLEVERIDKRRGQNFNDVFSEFQEVIISTGDQRTIKDNQTWC